MREKAVERRNVNKEHNSNFKAGYIPIDEDRLHKTGLRGRKGNLAICVIVLLFILAVINLLVSMWYTVLSLEVPWKKFSSFCHEGIDSAYILCFGTVLSSAHVLCFGTVCHLLLLYMCFLSLVGLELVLEHKKT